MTSAPSRPTSLRHQLARRKPIEQLQAEAAAGVDGEPLRRSLGVWHLTMISVGATLGTGILVVLGTAVPLAGPAVWISFVLAGVAALLSALSYAEMAGAVPTSGSSYSYTYATMGEGIAWVCGWCLVLEYAVSVAAVAVGASEYVDETLRVFGLHLPAAIAAPPGDGGVVNLPAAVLVLLAMAVLLPGARESAWVNTLMVVVKIALLVFFVVVAFTAFSSQNFAPLAPMGAAGVTAAASRLFFSYIGFDAASTAGEEAKDPRRDLPRAIIGSIVIVTTLYILVAIAAIGARPWTSFSSDEASLVRIVVDVTGQPVVALVFSIGAVIAIASVVLTVLYGQTRILLTMARDGMVPPVFGRVSPRTGTPVPNTLIVGVVVAVGAALVPLGELADATSIGTLVAFALVNVSVIVLRRTRPELERSYRVPLFPVVPVLGTLCCVLLAVFLGAGTWIAFGLWMLAGAVLYLAYGRRRSTLR
ncbi:MULTISPECIES: APC family permease [unclassified Curtobacterium]|uniref:APC family permease n=1 Tax=unclassified Curtobacterium TaxID=257496 RepID=UPI001AE3A5D1|nr:MULTISPECIES: amino acid permease [unclassified Curtobacterium]MBP1302307.1 APA family basic amino acid/polyamine antiporter [Curtobacterium sp. 1310]MCM3520181.1 amino acid permease [Curtobacterium sp. P97]MDB6425643.1 amino acid permease [Curtobacterium sp. 20TX0008]MDP9735328.1 APA family basic amino acid/polyamine antiporter [Curtobacterium sp. 260]